ncbi:TOBE domain-containing protein, partial [Acinetobacter baumannii]|uniref:TOBE domain-containing protein n=1 Tax=Acinetobacter baumannii TaxID=470 RepID=UPI000AF4F9F5
VKLYIRPEKLFVTTAGQPERPEQFHPATITQMNYLGASWEIDVSLLGKPVQILTPTYDASWQTGKEVMIG